MNVLKTLFNSISEETTFFESTYPLTNDFFHGDNAAWHRETEAVAVVKDVIIPGQLGHVKFQGVRWRACCDRALSLPPGVLVRVLGRRANILVVEPVEMRVVPMNY